MASNNFYLNNDPLLFNNSVDRPQFIDFERYRQQQTQPYDYLSELDGLIRSSQMSIDDKEYNDLSCELQTLIQNELMSSVRWKINSNPNAVRNMQRQIEIIKRVKAETDAEQRKNIDEINDYIKNYSDMTFDEYKKSKHENNAGKTKPK